MKKITNIFLTFVLIFNIVVISACSFEKKPNVVKVTDQEISITLQAGERKGKYTGDTVKGIPNGQGRFDSANLQGVKWYYEGEWKNGVFNGQGKSVWESGEIYEGKFINGIPQVSASKQETNIIDIDYIELWNKYSDKDYKGKRIRIVGKVDYISSNTLSIKDGLTGLTGSIYMKFEENNIAQLKKIIVGDYILATGECDGKTFGQISLSTCNIEDFGQHLQQKSVEYEKERKIKFAEEKGKYIANAKTISYESLIREPKKYEGEVIKVKVKIAQIMAGGMLTESGYRAYDGKNEWYINYKIPDDVSRIIDGDTVLFYGEFVGLSEMKRALTGTKDYVPKLKVEFYNIIK